MKIKDGFVMRQFAGRTVVVAVGEAGKTFNGVIKLNSTGRFLWERLQQEVTMIDLVAAMTDTYDIDKETAERDITAFLCVLKEAELLQ